MPIFINNKKNEFISYRVRPNLYINYFKIMKFKILICNYEIIKYIKDCFNY